jgi:hypothetical protein
VPGVVTPGLKDTITELKQRIGLPERLDGKTVLDIGAAEGLAHVGFEVKPCQIAPVW